MGQALLVQPVQPSVVLIIVMQNVRLENFITSPQIIFFKMTLP